MKVSPLPNSVSPPSRGPADPCIPSAVPLCGHRCAKGARTRAERRSCQRQGGADAVQRRRAQALGRGGQRGRGAFQRPFQGHCGRAQLTRPPRCRACSPPLPGRQVGRERVPRDARAHSERDQEHDSVYCCSDGLVQPADLCTTRNTRVRSSKRSARQTCPTTTMVRRSHASNISHC